jgi:hypothetical protein
MDKEEITDDTLFKTCFFYIAFTRYVKVEDPALLPEELGCIVASVSKRLGVDAGSTLNACQEALKVVESLESLNDLRVAFVDAAHELQGLGTLADGLLVDLEAVARSDGEYTELEKNVVEDCTKAFASWAERRQKKVVQKAELPESSEEQNAIRRVIILALESNEVLTTALVGELGLESIEQLHSFCQDLGIDEAKLQEKLSREALRQVVIQALESNKVDTNVLARELGFTTQTELRNYCAMLGIEVELVESRLG